jgi:hypothetical protein
MFKLPHKLIVPFDKQEIVLEVFMVYQEFLVSNSLSLLVSPNHICCSYDVLYN